MTPTDERLHAATSPASHIDFRLVVQQELIALDCALQLYRHADPSPAGRILFRLVQRISPPLLPRLMHGDDGGANQGSRVRMVRREQRHADT